MNFPVLGNDPVRKSSINQTLIFRSYFHIGFQVSQGEQNMNTDIPFGMLFEEKVPNLNYKLPEPIYDSEQNLSVILNKQGNLVPFVENMSAVLGTETATKVRAEGTDQDREICSSLGTRTISEVRTEPTDSDDEKLNASFHAVTTTRVKVETSDSNEDRAWAFMGTETFTHVRQEQSDSDEDRACAFMGTKTFTHVRQEQTDSDPNF